MADRIPASTPLQALAAAERAIRSRYTIGPDVDRRIGFVMGDVQVALEAAAPVIAAQAAAAERQRIARYRNALCPCRHRPEAVPAVTRVS